MPSTMAVLPTPGSPIRTGLFLVRLDRISIVVSTSSARPITGSSLPSRAIWVRFRLYSSRVGVELAGSRASPPASTPRTTAPRSCVGESEAREEPAGLRLLVCGQREQNVLGTDVGGTKGPRLVVGGKQSPLGVGGQRWRDVRAPALLCLLLQLGPDGLRVCTHLLEHAPDHPILQCSIEVVLAAQVEAAPLHCLLGCPLQEVGRGIGEVLGYVDLLRLSRSSHPAPSGEPCGLFVEESAEEVVEEAAAS